MAMTYLWELVKIGTLGCGLGKPVRRSWIGTALGSNLGPERNTSGW